jgi:ribonucleotide monophosphatase NagD (HAD superfamily)
MSSYIQILIIHLTIFYFVIVSHTAIKPEKTIIFGDRLSTDIQFGINSGISTCLVYSGIDKNI